MRAGLPEREPEFLKYWEENKIYEKKQELHAGHKKFVLHDGPPYANGKIHMGTALNKILKDIIMKYKYAQGFDTPYVPGWDTHGMPIEHAAIKNLGLNRHELDTLVLRKECHDYALKWIDEQRTDFKRLGVLGDWDHPYITMTHDYEAVQIHVFGEMAKKGYIYKGKKAVYWCPHCETALAEAEIEYGEEKSPAIFVKMPLVKDNGMLPEAAQGKPAYIVIWTTTPWTMPANVAIALHPDFEYAWVECEGEILFIDARNMGTLINRRTRILTPEDIETISSTYHNWRNVDGNYADVKGFCASVSLADVKAKDYVLTPGRYVGLPDEEDDFDFAERFTSLQKEFAEEI